MAGDVRARGVEEPGRRWRIVVFAVAVVFLALPLVATVLYSLATVWRNEVLPDGYTLGWWRSTLSDDRMLASVGRSLALALLDTALVTMLVLPPLYVAHRGAVGVRTLMQALALLPFALPFVVLAYGMKRLAGASAITTPYESSPALLLLGHVALTFPFFLWPVDAAMRSARVGRLAEAASTCGVSEAQTLLRVVVPAIRGGLVAGWVLVFATSVGEYSVVRVISGSSVETLPVWQVAQLRDTAGNPNGVAVTAVVLMVVLVVLGLVTSRLGGSAAFTAPRTGSEP